MSISSVNDQRLQLQRLILNASDLCSRLEQGQAEAPLTERMTLLAQEESNQILRVLLTGLTTESIVQTLTWLIQAPELAEVLAKKDSIRIRTGHPLSLQTATRYSPADSTEALTAMLADPVNAEVTLNLPAAAELAALDITVFSPATLGNTSRVARAGLADHLALVAAAPGHTLSAAEKQALAHLATAFSAVQPLLTVDELAGDAAIPENGWWQQISTPRPLVSPRLVTRHVRAPYPAFLANRHDPQREQWLLNREKQRLQDTVQLMADLHNQRRRHILQRQEQEASQLKALDQQQQGTQHQRQLWSALRQQLQDALPDLLRELSDRRRKERTQSGTGQLAPQLDRVVGLLDRQDLLQESGPRQTRLSLHPASTQRLLELVREYLKLECRSHAEALQSRLDTLRQHIEQALHPLAPGAHLSAAQVDGRTVAEVLQDMIGMEIRYRGEMPVRGLLDRFKEGRQGAMGFMMLASMAAMIFGGDLRSQFWFGPVMGLIFIGSMVFTATSWRQEDEEKLERELERLREGVRGELQRLLSELQREQQTRFNDMAERQRKQWQKELETLAEHAQIAQQSTLEQEKQALRQRKQVIDTQLQDINALNTALNGLVRDVEGWGG